MTSKIRELLLLAALILILGFSGAIIYKQGIKLRNFSDQISYQERIDNWFDNNMMFSNILLSGDLMEEEVKVGQFENKAVALILSDNTCQSCMEAEIHRLKNAKLNNQIVIYCVFESKRKFKTFQNVELKDFSKVELINCIETTWNNIKDPFYCMTDQRKIISLFCVDPNLNSLTEKWLGAAVNWSKLP